MLSENEKIECRKLLGRLSDEHLQSLKNTITMRQIIAETRNDTIKAIIDYSDSATELLNRQKIWRDILFQYCADSDIHVSAKATKPILMQKVLRYWSSLSTNDAHQVDAAVQDQLQQPEPDISALTELFENLNTSSQQQSSQPGAPMASVAAHTSTSQTSTAKSSIPLRTDSTESPASSAALQQLQADVTQHTSQVYNQSPTVSDFTSEMIFVAQMSEMDKRISSNSHLQQTSQVMMPALQNQVQCIAQNISSPVTTITIGQRNNQQEPEDPQMQLSLQFRPGTTDTRITNLTLSTTTTRPPVSTPNPAPQP